MTERPAGGLAVMQRRRSGVGALDFFPTPPFATRALVEDVLKPRGLFRPQDKIHDPCCGMGHMSEVLKEFYAEVFASDVHDYGCGYAVGNYPGAGGLLLTDRIDTPFEPDFVIANPPYNLAEEFFARAVHDAKFGVALLLRTSWLEGQERFRTIFAKNPPSIIAQFAERVPMSLGRWDPDGSTATSYSWMIWCDGKSTSILDTRFVWIPLGAEKRYSRDDDLKRFAALRLSDKDQAQLFDTLPASAAIVPMSEDREAEIAFNKDGHA